jgi:hypothetical protein
MSRGERTQRKERVVVVVSECSRLGASWLAQAYEQVVPIVRRAPAREAERGSTADGDQQDVPGGRA